MTTRSKILALLGWALCAALLGGLGWLLFAMRSDPMRGDKGKAISNGKQVRTALLLYASSNKSCYPDVHHPALKSANEVFRELFKEGVFGDEGINESIFIVPGSGFTIDNEIGNAPTYAEALKPGECHWMLLKAQTDAEHGKTPILIENSLKTSWPPRWNVAPDEGKRQKGQAWGDRTIIVVRSDGTADMEKLRPDGTLDWHSPNNLDGHGKSWIDYLTPEQIAKLEYWDVEHAKTNQNHAARP